MSAQALTHRYMSAMWTFIIAGLAVLSLAYTWRGLEKGVSMHLEPAGESQFASTKPGTSVKLVLEVTTVDAAGEIQGKLLNPQDDTHYTRTPTAVRIARDAGTAIVMGKASDVHPGAVIHVTGKFNADHRVQASQIVILTGYVHVK